MLQKSRIIGVGSFKPPIATNADYIEVFGRPAKVIDRKMEGKSRYSALDLTTGLPLYSNSEMAEKATCAALAMAKLEPNDIDLVVFSSATPDYPIPPCFTLLQERLGVKHWMGFDIRSGCAGFGTAIVAASQFLATGMAQRALIVGADLISSRYTPYYKLTKDGLVGDFPLPTLFNLMFFGDGAGAIIMDGLGDDKSGIFGMTMGSNRAHLPFGSVMPIGGSVHTFPSKEVDKKDWPIKQNGALTQETIPEVAGEAIARFLDENQITLRDIDKIIMPVVNDHMSKKLIEHLSDLSEENVISIGPEGGALANAAVPMSIEKGVIEGYIKKGTRLLIYSAENTRWQYAVIGAVW